MQFDLMTQVKKAALALCMHKASVELLPKRYTDDEVLVVAEDGQDAWWAPVLDGYCVWTSRCNAGWGTWAEVRVSVDLQRFYVVADEHQPWGTGMDISHRVATYDATELVSAIRHAIQVDNSDFALDGLIENEESGRYERFSSVPHVQLSV